MIHGSVSRLNNIILTENLCVGNTFKNQFIKSQFDASKTILLSLVFKHKSKSGSTQTKRSQNRLKKKRNKRKKKKKKNIL